MDGKKYDVIVNISIHAPARGATFWNLWESRTTTYFNPRSREGSDFSRAMVLRRTTYFNPRSREGSDIISQCVRLPLYDFNPRSREGSDEDMPISMNPETISIHAPARGATEKKIGTGFSNFISIHAPARGATKKTKKALAPFDISIHAPARGATYRPLDAWEVRKNFNPRSREGSDRMGNRGT